MPHNQPLRSSRFIVPALVALCLAPVSARPQTPAAALGPSPSDPNALADSLRALEEQIQQLKTALGEVRAEAAGARAEAQALRRELEAARAQVPPAPAANDVSAQAQTIEQRVERLEEDQQLAEARSNEQYQTKVESASKYRVRLSGIALLNLMETRGSVENLDFPTLAQPSGGVGGTFSGSLRQSELGLEVFGPELAGAKTSGNVQIDFAGGFPQEPNGATLGLLRLRTAVVRLDWTRTSVIAGQDNLFFAPLAPTSLASLAIPALAGSGNLWAWTPQVRVEHRFFDSSESGGFSVQAGILDGLTGEMPQTEFYRAPSAAEQSGQPAYASHIQWSRRLFGRTLRFGVGGYYGRQDWNVLNAARNIVPSGSVDSWVGNADWTVPFAPWLELSGEFWRGRAIGGLGGGIVQSVATLAKSPLQVVPTAVLGIESVGGWAQLKFIPVERFEVNAAYGQDNPLASSLARIAARGFLPLQWNRNQTGFLNFIYRLRSNVLLSAEYRHIRTTSPPATIVTADLFDLSLGILF